MKLPQMVSDVPKSKKYIIEFGGINRSSRFSEGELWDTQNLSSDLSPYISQRGKREKVRDFEAVPTALFAHNGVAAVVGNTFYWYEDLESEVYKYSAELSEGRKSIVQLGDYTVIFPDRKAYNAETNEWLSFGNSYPLAPKWYSGNVVSYGTWVYHNRLLVYDVSTSDSKTAAGSYASDIYAGLRAGDVVSVSGSGWIRGTTSSTHTIEANNIKIKSIEYSSSTVTVYFEDNALFDTETVGEIVVCMTSAGSIWSEVPEFSHVCVSNGRIWGTSGNTIYASEYGSYRNFNTFEGLSSDSYAIEVTSAGEFTGCAAYSSHIVFFKENCIHKLYGSRPSNFSLVTANVAGVQGGSGTSVVMINEMLFYKGVDGIYVYVGATPTLVSEGLTEQYKNAVAGAFKSKYYVSMQNADSGYELFVYDTRNGILLKEDNTEFKGTARFEGGLLYIDADGGLNRITESCDTEGVEWSADFRELTETVNEKKGYSRICLRVELDEGAHINAELALDNGKFELLKTISRAGRHILCINVPPNRCDSFRIRLFGRGGCRVINMVREFITGSGVR